MAKHFLYLTNERLTCLVWQRGRFLAKEEFSAYDPLSPVFSGYLAKHRKIPAYLVLDLTEEDFRVETIPHLRGRDQQAVLNRRLGQIYRGTPFRHAVIQGRNEEGRRDDRVLYHGITNADLVKPWLGVLLKHGVPIEGVYSAPVLSGHLLKTLDIFFPHTLLVSLGAGEGLRQTYFQNKQVKFSRLTPLEGGGDVSYGQQIAEETSRTWQYLDSLRYFGSDEKLEVCLLIHPSEHKSVSDAIRDFPLLQHRVLSTDDVAQVLKLKPPPLSSHAEELFAHLFAISTIENHFAQHQDTRDARLRRVGFGLQAIAAGTLVASLGTAAVMYAQAREIATETQARDIQARQMTDRYKALLGQMQLAQVSAETSRETAAFHGAFLQPLPAPGSFLRDISQVLMRFPEVKLAQVGWLSSDDDKVTPVVTPLPGSSALPLRSETKTIASMPVTTAASSAQNQLKLAGNRHQIIVLDAAVAPFSGDYRLLLARIDRFLAALNAMPSTRATLMTSPLDTRSSASIKATLATQLPAQPEGRFTVRVIRNMQTPDISP